MKAAALLESSFLSPTPQEIATLGIIPSIDAAGREIDLTKWTNEVPFFHRGSQQERSTVRKEHKRSKPVCESLQYCFQICFPVFGYKSKIRSWPCPSRNLQPQLFYVQIASSNAFAKNEKVF